MLSYNCYFICFRFVSSHLALDHIEIKVKDDRTIYLNTSLGIKLDFLLAYHFESVRSSSFIR